MIELSQYVTTTKQSRGHVMRDLEPVCTVVDVVMKVPFDNTVCNNDY